MRHVTVQVFSNERIGIWQGMGGAITEATAYNFEKLSSEKQKDFIDAYYGKDGLDYTWGRVAIGSNDFCLTPYECTVKKNMGDFSISVDEQYVLPLLKKILQRKELILVASPWSPPSFMKTNKGLFGGKLKRNCYSVFARYLRKWLEAYKDSGVEIEYITPQNEPMAIQEWESCVYDFVQQRRLIYKYLIPELKSLNTKILVWDHNKTNLREVARELLTDGLEEDKVAGLAFHWYEGIYESEMRAVKKEFSNKLLIATEMCCGFSEYDINKWKDDAELYIKEIFADVNAGVDAWIDWNMLLDWRGGPSHKQNYVKSPVIMNRDDDDFILTPIYEHLKKIAQFIPAGSKIVSCKTNSKDVLAIAKISSNNVSVLLFNLNSEDVECEVVAENKRKIKKIAAHSFCEIK